MECVGPIHRLRLIARAAFASADAADASPRHSMLSENVGGGKRWHPNAFAPRRLASLERRRQASFACFFESAEDVGHSVLKEESLLLAFVIFRSRSLARALAVVRVREL